MKVDPCVRTVRGARLGLRSPGRVVLLLLLAWLGGCSRGGYLQVQKVPRNPLAQQLQLLSRTGPKPQPRTNQLLRRYDLDRQQLTSPESVLEELGRQITADPNSELVYALTELTYIHAQKADALGRRDEAMDLYGASVAYAYMYLFDPRLDNFRNPYDPQFRGACDLFNSSLEGALRIVNREGQLRPGATLQIVAGGQQFDVLVAAFGAWKPSDFARLEFANDYDIEGLRNRYHTYGLGVPLIAVREAPDNPSPQDRYYPVELSFPVTAFLRVMPDENTADGKHRCLLELHDPLHSNTVEIANRVVPLETDLTTALGYFLDSPRLKVKQQVATLGLLRPDVTQELSGIYMLEPYDPQRVPVIMVHGLWSSPLTWMEMFNDLRGFAEIRDRYQFWFYMYPTGQPFWISAAQFRQDLATMRQTVDPQRQNPLLDRMVLVGHSMGGLVSRMQTVDSQEHFWHLISNRPFEELKADDQTRQRVANALFFRPNPSVSRVITIGTPHRGSDFANDYTRWASRKVINLPQLVLQTSQGLLRDNPDFFHDTELLTVSTSIDSLAPSSPIFPALFQAGPGPWVHYHNIVGVVPQKAWQSWLERVSGRGDGIVAVESAHLDGAESEIVVEADHITVHRHPLAVLEVRRVLRLHTQETMQLAQRGLLLPTRPDSAPAWADPTLLATASPTLPVVAPGYPAQPAMFLPPAAANSPAPHP